jgi:tetratricopeptide (TPR) repeat protein
MAEARPSAARPIAAVFLLCLAIAAWAWAGSGWLRDRPVRQHLSAGIAFADQGQGPQAEAEWKEALRLDPHCADACRLLAEYYLSARAWQKGITALQRLRALAPQEEHIDCRLSACYLNLGDEVSAFRYSEADLRRDQNCVPALATSSILLNKVSEKPRALIYLRRLARLQPDDPVLQYMLAETLSDLFNYREARPVLERVLRLDPNHAEAYSELGLGWLDDASVPDHLDRADRALRRSLELNPLLPEARLALGRLLLQRNQPREAIAQLEEAARLMPENTRPPNYLARAFDQAGMAPQAAAMRRRFLVLRQLSSRVTMLQKRSSVNPTVFDYPYQLGMIELGRGDYRRAYVWLNKAKALRPADRRVAAALTELSRRTAGPSRLAEVQDRIAGRSGVQAFGRSGVQGGTPGADGAATQGRGGGTGR